MVRSRRRRALAAALLVLCAPAFARAQTDGMGPEDGATFAESTGVVWGVASFETWFLAQGMALGAMEGCGDGDDDAACVLLLAASSLAAGTGAGIVAGAQDAPVEVPFVTHHGLWGGAAGIALGLGLAGDDDDLRGLLAVAGFLIGSGAVSGYAWARRDRLLHDPAGADGAHVMTWGVPIAGILAAIVGAIVSEDGPTTALFAAVAGISTYLIGIGMAER